MDEDSSSVQNWHPELDGDFLCGPLRVKSYIDISEQSVVLSVTHPKLLLCSSVPVILICFQDLFVGHYSKVTEDVSRGSDEKKVDTDLHAIRRRTCGLRPRILRKPPQPAKPVILIHSSLQVTIFAYHGNLDSIQRECLLGCIFQEDVIIRLLLAACGYHIEESEYTRLPEYCHSAVIKYHEDKKNIESLTVEEIEKRQFRALDLLCWIASLAYCNENGYV